MRFRGNRLVLRGLRLEGTDWFDCYWILHPWSLKQKRKGTVSQRRPMPSTDAMFPSRTPIAQPQNGPGAAFNSHLYQIRDLIYQIAGILQPDHRLEFLEKRCQKRM